MITNETKITHYYHYENGDRCIDKPGYSVCEKTFPDHAKSLEVHNEVYRDLTDEEAERIESIPIRIRERFFYMGAKYVPKK